PGSRSCHYSQEWAQSFGRVVLLLWLAGPVIFSSPLAAQQNVVAPPDKATRAVWVAAAQYNVQDAKDYGSIVMAASLNAFYKTYANATPAQAEDVVTAIQTRLSGLPKIDYVFAHQTQEELVHAAFNIVGDTSLPPAA